MRRPRHAVTDALLATLQEFGPMTSLEVWEHNKDIPRADLRKALARLAEPTKQAPQRVHISGWTRDAEGYRTYLRPIYSAGPGENAERPPAITRTEIARNWQRKRKTKIRTNFVFNLGTPLDVLTMKRLGGGV